MGYLDVTKVAADVTVESLGRPAAEDFDGMVGGSLSGSSQCVLSAGADWT